MPQRLFAEFDTENQKVGDDGLLRHRLYQLGEWEHGTYGPFTITAEMHAMIVANFDKPNLDYEHFSAHPEVGMGGPVPSAGRTIAIEPELDAEGWAWGTSKLTARAAEMVNAGEYRGYSPEIWFKAKDRKGKECGTYLAAGALTNRPFFPIELRQVAATNSGAQSMAANTRYDETTGSLFVQGPLTLAEGEEMDIALPEGMELAPIESDEPQDESEMPAVAASLKAITDKNAVLADNVKKLEARLAASEAAQEKARFELFLAQKAIAPAQHKMLADIHAKMGMTGVESVVASLGNSIIVPLGERGTANSDTLSGADVIAKELTEFRKANPKASLKEAYKHCRTKHPAEFAEFARKEVTA